MRSGEAHFHAGLGDAAIAQVRGSRGCGRKIRSEGGKAIMTISRRTFLAGAATAGALVGSGAWAQSGSYPNRPITLVVPWGTGGGTDATARTMASIMERELGQPINVVNRTGGSGVVGHSAIATAAPDGYTIGMITVEIAMMHHQGLTQLDPASYTPLALLNSDPPAIHVKADGPYKDLNALVEAIKSSPPGKIKASGTGQGGIWHIGLIGWLQAMGMKFDHVAWVPSNGAGPAMQDLAAGGIDVVTCSAPEGRALADAGKTKILAVMSANRNPVFPNVPTLKEAMNIDYTAGAWRGLAGPKGLPADVQARLVTAIENAYKSKEFNDFVESRGFGKLWYPTDQFASFMAKDDVAMGNIFKNLKS
jgi:putative tricarboxylic transport membrane protein